MISIHLTWYAAIFIFFITSDKLFFIILMYRSSLPFNIYVFSLDLQLYFFNLFLYILKTNYYEVKDKSLKIDNIRFLSYIVYTNKYIIKI